MTSQNQPRVPPVPRPPRRRDREGINRADAPPFSSHNTEGAPSLRLFSAARVGDHAPPRANPQQNSLAGGPGGRFPTHPCIRHCAPSGYPLGRRPYRDERAGASSPTPDPRPCRKLPHKSAQSTHGQNPHTPPAQFFKSLCPWSLSPCFSPYPLFPVKL
jgi:hypothetical protein